MKKSKLYLVISVAVAFFGLSLMCWFKERDAYSESERRVLAGFPAITEKDISSGKFMTDFEDYTLDQFPFRDTFRTIKAIAQFGIFGQKDNNDIYMVGDYVSKLEYPLKDSMIENAGKRFQYLYDTYMADKDINIYLSIVPDKNYFLAEDNGYLSMDYEKLVADMREKTTYMEYIDIMDLLTIEDYYKTDTHWRQEAIVDLAAALSEAMGNTLSWEYEERVSPHPFYGVYYGQSALPLKSDTLTYLTNEQLEACMVTSYNTGKPVEKDMYDLTKLEGRDPYEMFLSGNDALLVVENPNASSDKELVVFRDSFGSSILPLMVESYAKVTIVDIRYISSAAVGSFVEFKNQDVLFLYSTLLLNSSTAFK